MSNWEYTHRYDGQIGDRYRAYIKIDKEELTPPSSLDRTILEIEIYIDISSLDSITDRNARAACRLIMTGSTYDAINRIEAKTILCQTWRFVRCEQFEKHGSLFLEQLADITGKGPCPQGMSTRLFQLYSYYMDAPDSDTYKSLLVGTDEKD